MFFNSYCFWGLTSILKNSLNPFSFPGITTITCLCYCTLFPILPFLQEYGSPRPWGLNRRAWPLSPKGQKRQIWAPKSPRALTPRCGVTSALRRYNLRGPGLFCRAFLEFPAKGRTSPFPQTASFGPNRPLSSLGI